MATLVLTAAATAFTAAAGTTALTTALITTAATVAGKLIDNALFGGGKDQHYEGPRLESLQILSSTQGASIARAYGRVRLSGQIIWATNIEEVITTNKQKTGGKGGGGSTSTTTEYSYFANMAIGICEGPVGYLNRIWADGKELDLTSITYRFRKGTNNQEPDSLIESVEGVGKAPGYCGLCYVVFERLPLAKYGNRIPQLTFEIVRPSPTRELETSIKGLNLIPGATEFGYDPDKIEQNSYSSSGVLTGKKGENFHTKSGKSDWDISLDQMKEVMPGVQSICLVVSWFFDDLRCGNCEVKPRVENATKQTTPHTWKVSGLSRAGTPVVSYVGVGADARPAFGGTPNDASVIRAIQDLKARGYNVMVYPFMMGDIPSGNGLPNPYGGTGQAVFPWRGRINCHPAPGVSGTVDKTATAGSQISAFVGTSSPAHFSISGATINYTGPNEWKYRRFILHIANLAKAAGGVHSFCIGSEMVGVTQVRDTASHYPFVDALVTLAGDVRTVMGASPKIGYAADWSEYHSHRPVDGTGDVFFNMDPLWADNDIDFIGIDNYLPLADWRAGSDHADYDVDKGYTTTYNLDYLKSNMEGGEHYDWYYASDTARVNQTRSPITDGLQGKDWIYRQKDIRNWWENSHQSRPGGTPSSTTAWIAKSKPIWFTEVGCPAVDKAANQPNVFYDPKSSESFLPHFSTGARDDVIQRRFIQAVQEYWQPGAGNNPVSPVYGSYMIDPNLIHIWSWDARPFPSWPLNGNTWGDADNWQFGHWLSARMGTVYVPDMMEHIASDYGFTLGDYEEAYGACDGYVVDRTMSFRDAMSPLGLTFFFDIIESGAAIKAITRLSTPLRLTVNSDNVVDAGEGAEPAMLIRSQETEMPRVVRLKFVDSERAYAISAVQATRDNVKTVAISEVDVPIVIDEPRAQAAADLWLADAWASRESGSFSLMPSAMALEVGDVVRLEVGEFTRDLRLIEITDGEARKASGSSFIDTQLSASPVARSNRSLPPPPEVTLPIARFMDIPLLRDEDTQHSGYVAATATKWPGGVSFFRSLTQANWQANTLISAPAVMGETLTPFAKGPVAIWDRANSLDVQLYQGELESVDDLTLLAGENAFAVQTSSGEWEIFQARDVTLIGTNTYRLSMFLRGQLGSEHAIEDSLAAGAPLVLLGDGIDQVSMSLDDVGLEYQWRYGPVGEAVGSEFFTTEPFQFNGISLRPYAPVHVQADIVPAGDVVINWTRRTRIGGDSWVLVEIPLGEDVENYEIDILDDLNAVVRTLQSSIPTITYTAAQIAIDFQSGFTAWSVKVYQLSSLYGRGIPAFLQVS